MKVKIEREELTISAGNTKMGKVASISRPPVATCSAGVPCSGNCYAAKLCRIYKTVRDSYWSNESALAVLAEIDPSADMTAAAIAAAIRGKYQFFRWNVSGDFARGGRVWSWYYNLACKTAERCPDVRFLAFTKVYDILGLPRPSNFNVVASIWNDYAPDADPSTYAAAHYNDGSRAMPANATECGGNCEACGMCFNLRPGEAVYFNKH